jgi:hypothetical protein
MIVQPGQKIYLNIETFDAELGNKDFDRGTLYVYPYIEGEYRTNIKVITCRKLGVGEYQVDMQLPTEGLNHADRLVVRATWKVDGRHYGRVVQQHQIEVPVPHIFVPES